MSTYSKYWQKMIAANQQKNDDCAKKDINKETFF